MFACSLKNSFKIQEILIYFPFFLPEHVREPNPLLLNISPIFRLIIRKQARFTIPSDAIDFLLPLILVTGT
jgi:hypothetical protein